MRKFLAGVAVIVAVTSATAAAPALAESGTGKVIVFSTEFTELAVWEDPEGCTQLPPAAHVLANQTDEDIEIHGDPLCLTAGATVAPGYGSHVPAGAGSFSVDR